MMRESTQKANHENMFLLRKMIVVLFAVMLSLSVLTGAKAAEAAETSVTIAVQYGQTEARKIVDMINQFRSGSEAWYWDSNNSTKTTCKNLVQLTYDYQLEKVAMLRAAEIALSYSHERPNGEKSFSAYTDLGYSYSWVAENIAAGYQTAAEVFEGWKEADEDYDGQGHRRATLSNSYNAVGIAHVYYNGFHYWVEEFGIATHAAKTTANNSVTKVALDVATSKIQGVSLAFDTDPELVRVQSVASVSSIKLDVQDQWPAGVSRPVVNDPVIQTSNSCVEKYSGGKVVGRKEGTSALTVSVCSQKTTVNFTVHDCQKNAVGTICSVCGALVNQNKSSSCSHIWSDWEETKEATVCANGVEERECILCGEKATQNTAKLKATIKLSKTKLVLKKGKSYTVKVSMTKGDSVKSWKSSNKKVASVNKKGKITAKKSGKAVITVTLKSGKSAKVKVIVR